MGMCACVCFVGMFPFQMNLTLINLSLNTWFYCLVDGLKQYCTIVLLYFPGSLVWMYVVSVWKIVPLIALGAVDGVVPLITIDEQFQ